MTTPDIFISLQLALHIVLSCILTFTVAQNPVDTYAPTVNVNCPETSGSLVRTFTPQTQVLNTSEAEYIASRESNVISNAWSNWLGNASDIGYNFEDLQGKFPRIGIAVGGEGYRTAQYGAGVLLGLDWRNTTARDEGTGGLLQVASYLSASSGGSWLLGSLLMNDWPSLLELVYGNGGNLSSWLLDLDLIVPSSPLVSDGGNQAYWGSILASVESKATTGVPTSVTDLWGRMVAYHFLNQTTRGNFYTNQTSHGAGQLWSQMSHLPNFQNHTIPFPIVTADSRYAGSGITTNVPLNSTVYEITPFEFGSWDPGLSAMLPMHFAGTYLTNGLPANPSACVTGFDQASFVMGTSSSFFNAVLNVTEGTFGFNTDDGDEDGMKFIFDQLLSHTPSSNVMDAANWPNPFKGVNSVTFQDSSSDRLELLDGGSNLEKTPLSSLLVKARGLDVVVVIDGSADDGNLWPNGTSLITSFERISSVLSSSHQPMPPIPGTAAQFVSTGVNMRPTFFGCNLTQGQPAYPIVVYLPNAPPLDGSAPATNTGNTQFSYTSMFTAVFINQAFWNTLGGFKPNTTSPDPNWGKCLQCVAIDRAVTLRSDFCSQCFAQYCYDPNNPPSQSELPGRQFAFVNPDLGGLQKVTQWLEENKGRLAGIIVTVILVIAGIVGFIFWWRKRRARRSRYSRVDELRDDDEPWRYYENRSLELTRRMSIT
ncbi:phospholipase B [Suillus clintonianus]|uniref:phospholipase B n=1 Tax=Suillus clintonianus TaxID=1904413 RepID=UPI001B863950|nr:phospholipase B [Suillus clintonianus]KAG2150555.1 phospholipase B [Suillus clintonianus]